MSDELKHGPLCKTGGLRRKYLRPLWSMTDCSNYPEMSGDYYKRYNDAMEYLHEHLMDLETVLHHTVATDPQTVGALIDEIERYKKVLSFYATDTIYEHPRGYLTYDGKPLEHDKGKRAKEAPKGDKK